jgi:hypothetical protein
MIFISNQSSPSGVFFRSARHTTAGDHMIKLIATALLSAGIAAAAMAADMPKSDAPMTADAPMAADAPGAAAPAAGTTSSASSKTAKKHGGKKSKKSTAAASTSK